MKKKILFMSSAKLTAICMVLLLAVFCTIGMSFTPAEEGENMGNPNDSTYVSGPRRSHWDSSSGCGTDHNNKPDYGQTKATTDGHGTVYASTSDSDQAGADDGWSTAEDGAYSAITWNCGISDSDDHGAEELTAAHSRTHYVWAKPSDGYYFKQWNIDEPDAYTSTDNPATITYTIPTVSAKTDNQITTYETSPGYVVTAAATFSPVTVDKVTPDSKDLDPENARTDCNDYTGTVVFETTGADDLADFDVLDFSQDGNGTFTITSGPSLSGSHVTLEYKFVGSGVYGTRTNQATFTLSSKAADADPRTKTSTITANYPNVSMSGSDVEVNTLTGAAATSGSFTVNTMFADGTGDFASIPSAFSPISGESGTWTLNSCTFNGTDFATGEGSFTVNYTFTPSSTEGTTTAEFTLTAKDGVGGESKTILLAAHVEAPELEYEASVTIGSGEPVKYEHLSEAIEAANAVAFNLQAPVVKLLQDVTVNSPLELSRTMKLDLNAFTLTGNLSASATSVLLIENQNAIVTLCSERAGGKLIASGNYAGRLSAVEVNKGKFVLQSGDVVLSNTNTGSTADKLYACGVYLSMSQHDSYDRPTSAMQMIGGSITVNRPNGGAYAYGVYCDGSTAKNTSAADLRNATITTTVTNGSNAYGAFLSGESPVNNMTITANANTYAYGVWVNDGATVVMEDGQYIANATTSQARAVNSHGTLRIQSGRYLANPSADDDLTDVTGSDAIAVNVTVGTAAINDGTFTANATTGAYALQLVANSGTPSANVTSGIFTAKAKTSTAAAVHLTNNTSITTTGGTFRGVVWRTLAEATDLKAYGLWAEGANTNANLSNSSFAATLAKPLGNLAYGIKSDGALTLNQCAITATATNNEAYALRCNGGTIINCEQIRADAGNTGAYGIYVENVASNVTNITNTTIQCEAKQTRAFGGYIYGGTFTAENTNFISKAQANATAAGASTLRGLLFQPGVEGTLNNCQITATGNASYSQTVYGLYDKGNATINNTTITVENAKSDGYSLYVEGGVLNVYSGHFKALTKALHVSPPAGIELSGGFWSSNANLSSYLKSGCAVYDVPEGYSDRENGYLYSIGTPDNPGYAICRIVQTGKKYLTLVEALQEVEAEQTILMLADYTLPAGNHTLPANTTLLIPYMANQKTALGEDGSGYAESSPSTPSCFRKLTLATGATLVVKGTMEASAQLSSAGGSDANSYLSGATRGKYGHIFMQNGSEIILKSGASLFSWGFVSGEGSIDVESGAKSYEPFVLGWFKGGTALGKSAWGNYKTFPFTDYYFQNIEVPIKYRPGAKAYGKGFIHGNLYSASAQLVGTRYSANSADDALFLMDQNDTRADSWVQKVYHTNEDRVEWIVNSGANLSNILLNLQNIASLNTNSYYLPITNNMTITLNYGKMDVLQNVVFIPGSCLNIKKEATVSIPSNKAIYLYDALDWVAPSSNYFLKMKYSPTWGTSNPRQAQTVCMPSAEVFVHGKFEIQNNAYLYSTENGANIHSTDADAGMVYFLSDAATSTVTLQQASGQKSSTPSFAAETASAAQLKNGDGTFEQTAGTKAGQLWGYKGGKWIKMQGGDCLYEELDADGNHTGVINAYPSSFVEVEANDPDDHAYHTTADASKYVINVDASTASTNPICTWWDAIPKENGHYMISNEKSDLDGAYYYFDGTAGYWKPRAYRINWYNNNSLVIYNNVARNAKPKFTGKGYNSNNTLVTGKTITVPTQTGYDFYWDGWVSNNDDRLNPDVRIYTNDDMPRATGDVTYYAHFRKEVQTFTITFVAEDGKTTIERQTVAYGEMPVCSASPSKTSSVEEDYTLYWTVSGTTTKYLPENIPTTTDAVTYVATFVATPRLYTITFANYNTEILKQGDVPYDTPPTPPANPTRQNDGFYSYDFIGWKAGKVFIGLDENGDVEEMPAVTGLTTYTAQFSTTDWTPEYTITFQDEDGTVLQTQHIRLGNSLVDPAETLLASGKLVKTEDAGYTYSFDGWTPVLIDKPTADAIYTAKYAIASTKQYTVTFKDEDGFTLQSAKVNYGENPVYNKELPTKEQDAEWVYTFGEWEPEIEPVNGEQTYTAIYTKAKRKYTILFKNGDITFTNSVAPDNKWEYGVTPYIEGVTPTKEPVGGYYFAFDGWTPVATPVTNDMTYYAHFSQTLETHTVTWKSENGSVTLRTDEEVPYGSIPTYEGVTPTKDGDDEYSYTYDGWSNEVNGTRLTPPLPALTEDAIFYAHFAQTKRTYTVTWENEDHTVLETDEGVEYGDVPHYDGATPTKANTEEYVYSFNGWNNKPATITGKVTITATYNYAATVASVTAGGNTVYFASMPDAFADAGTKRDATIKLFKDYDGSLTYATSLTNNTCVLDMNGKSISALMTISNGSAGFTISNGTIENNSGTAIIVNAGKLIIANNTIINGHSSAIRLETGSVLEMNGGTVRSNAASDISALYMNSGSEATIDGGTINVTATGNKAHAIYVDGGEVTLANGVINANANQEAYGIYVNSGSATVNGGLITATSNTTGAYDVYLTASGNGVITGGKFKASGMSDVFGVNGIAAANKFDISGGFYQQNDNLAKYAKSPYGLRELDEDDAEYAEGYRHTVSSTFDITIDDEQPLEVSTSASTTVVTTNGSLDINTGVTLNTVKLYIESKPENDQSGELNGNVEMPDNGKAYFDLILSDTEPRHWHAFSVPFQVNLKKSGTPLIVNGEKLTLGRGYDIVYYDGAERAKNGKSAACWKYVEDPVAVGGGDSILYPGRAYMIASGSRALNRIRFTKATGAALMNNTVDVSANISETSDDKDGGWNGIGNPKLSHAVLDAGVALCQVHDGGKIGEDGYMPYILENKKLVVGRAVFVQVGEDPSVVVKSANGKGEIEQYVNPAPRRASAKNKEDRYEVMIASSNGTMADRLFILADEEKEDKYVILEDVAKAGISPVRAQMWVDRYGEKLCMNTTALINGKANYPLTISTPKTGEYEIFLNGQAKEGTTLYLTYDGKAIWNLTYGGYTAALEKGTNTHYGLRVVINKVATEIEQTTIENGDAVRKVIVNDKVYIIRNGEIYSITGQKAQ